MWRWLWLGLSIVAITWLEFRFFPGHTYLRADSQIFVPMLERLAAPAFLSRDLVATSPHLVFTAYDEITLLLHKLLHQNFHAVLTAQQLLCRASAVLGIFLLASSTGLRDYAALLIAAVVNMGAALPGAAVALTELEAVPHGFAFSFCLLALGLLAVEKPLLSGVAGGAALLYHPPLAAALWITVAVSFVLDRKLRHLLRPMLTTLLVFVLLLGNLAQLQPGVTDTQAFFQRVSANWLSIQRERTPEVLVSTWPGRAVLFYLAVFLVGAVASTRFWISLNRQCKWFGTMLLFGGVLSLPLSGLLLDVFRWSLIPQVQPARALLFTTALSLTAAGVAAVRAFERRRPIETAIWCAFTLLVPLGTQLSRFHPHQEAQPAIRELATWAEQNTWGGSMFLFPDAGRNDYPGTFRAESIRAIYVDWNGGELAKYFQDFAKEWEVRWMTTMAGDFSPQRLQGMLALPVDYYVLRRKNALNRVQPAFATPDFVVYERHELKNAATPLQLISPVAASY